MKAEALVEEDAEGILDETRFWRKKYLRILWRLDRYYLGMSLLR